MSTSFAAKIANVNDYLTPANECTVSDPLVSVSKKPSLVKPTDSGKAEVLLSDCLACSGCLGTSEDILLKELINVEKLSGLIADTNSWVVLSIAQESWCNLHAYLEMETLAETRRFVQGFFGRHFGITLFAHLDEATQSFVDGYAQGSSRPMVPSFCPGLNLYLEKNGDPQILDYLDPSCSPAGRLGETLQGLPALAWRQAWRHWFVPQVCPLFWQDFWEVPQNMSKQRVFHLHVAPCFDKKLESFREVSKDFLQCVMTTREVVDLMKEVGVDLKVRAEPLRPALSHSLFADCIGDFALKNGRNSQIRERFTENGWVLFSSGFRNIHNVMQRLLKPQARGLYEVAACPDGCLKGGGQLPVSTPWQESAPSWREDVLTQICHAAFRERPPAQIEWQSIKSPDLSW